MNYRNENQAQSLGHHPTFTWQQLQAAVLAEREACAKVCEQDEFQIYETAERCAEAIRARGEK